MGRNSYCVNGYPDNCDCPVCTRDSRHSRNTGGVAAAIVTGAITLGQAFVEPQQNGTNTQGNWADSSMEIQGSDVARTLRGATRDKGHHSGDSSQD